MADLGYGGRVLAGEDSEEDEEEEELGFQFGGFSGNATGATASTTIITPKFSVQTAIVTTPNEESDEEKEEEDVKDVVLGERQSEAAVADHQPNSADDMRDDAPVEPVSVAYQGKHEDEWVIGESVDGIAMMGQSIVRKVQPSMDATIRRIAELSEAQQRLLALLTQQNKNTTSNTKIENIALVMNKLPQYVKKVQDMKIMMAEISTSVDKLNKRAENFRVDAQSHAIKKENKRESLSQWNKLYAAKSSETTNITSTSMTSSSTN